jgi:type IV pilus assembly protein PilZ
MSKDRISSATSRTGALSLNIREKSILYAAYMPFVKGGGIFIPTTRPYRLGDEIFMLISLLGDPDKIPVAGKVVWVTPAGSQGSRAQGVGVQFNADESGEIARARIDGLLKGQTVLNRNTHTM